MNDGSGAAGKQATPGKSEEFGFSERAREIEKH